MSLQAILAAIGGVLYISAFLIPKPIRRTIWGGATFGLIIGGIAGLVMGDIVSGLMWGFSIGTLTGLAAAVLEAVGHFVSGFLDA